MIQLPDLHKKVQLLWNEVNQAILTHNQRFISSKANRKGIMRRNKAEDYQLDNLTILQTLNLTTGFAFSHTIIIIN